MEKQNHKIGIVFAVLAATLYAINSPFSKILLDFMPPTIMAGFLYLGAGVGMGMMALASRVSGNHSQEEGITCKELPYTIAMILLDVAAPIFLLLGLSMTTAANASLLNNFEIVATSFIALIFFGENISKRLWCGIAFITISCTVLTFEGILPSYMYFIALILMIVGTWLSSSDKPIFNKRER